MNVAIITDQHFGARNDSVTFLDFYQQFYDGTFFPKLKENGIHTLLILGDTFDRRKYVNFLTLKRTKEMFFDKLLELNIQVYMLAGNHDTFHKNSNNVNSVDLLLNEYPNVTVIDAPQTIMVGGQYICMIPWICTENYQQCLDEIKNTKAPICMGHFEISGFSMYKGMAAHEGLDRALFRKFFNTFSGHYHHRSSADSIFYLGNPYQLTWSDYDDTRGFHVYDIQNFDLTFIPNPNEMFVKIVYDDTILDTKYTFSDYTNRFVKVVVLNKTDPYKFDKFMDDLYNVNPTDVTIVEDAVDLIENVSDDEVTQSEDTLSILNKFVDSIREDNIDNVRLKNILHEIYVEALNSERV